VANRIRPLTAALIALAVCCISARATAQSPPLPLQSEVRLDGLLAQDPAAHAGFGLSVPAGIYVRTGLIVGAGAGRHGFEGRTDLIARFTFDPLRQSRWAPYGGAGVSTRFNSAEENGAKGFLLLYLGMEGPLAQGRSRGFVPFFEVGLGGGTRVGIGLRRAIHSRR
jgi:hypothetical protein